MLRPEPRRERRQWAIAHEIGEHLASRVFALLGVDPGEAPANVREQVANQVAGRLLLPTEQFLADARACDWNLCELKQRYDTASHELIARRMLDFSIPLIVTIFDHARITWRRSNLPGRVPRLTAWEERCWRQAHETGLPQVATERGSSVQAWPVHEPDWKREILRTRWEPWEEAPWEED